MTVVLAALISCEALILCPCGEYFSAWSRDDGTITGACNCGDYYVIGRADLFLRQYKTGEEEQNER